MTLHFFTIKNGIIEAGAKIDGKRYIVPVMEQNKRAYICIGSKINKDRQRFDFSDNQQKLLDDFIKMDLKNLDFFEGV